MLSRYHGLVKDPRTCEGQKSGQQQTQPQGLSDRIKESAKIRDFHGSPPARQGLGGLLFDRLPPSCS